MRSFSKVVLSALDKASELQTSHNDPGRSLKKVLEIWLYKSAVTFRFFLFLVTKIPNYVVLDGFEGIDVGFFI